jgi:hypothetical protein
MAEERNVALARAAETGGDTDATKAELQRRMEEARESISQTVTEIKDTVVNQYQQVRETISDTLDWREQYRRHTLPMTIGAVGAGFLLGYVVMGAFKSDGEEYDEEGDYGRGEGYAPRSYAAAPILGQAHAPTAYQRASVPGSNAQTEGTESFAAGAHEGGAESRPSYSSGYQASTSPTVSRATEGEEEEEEEKGPSLFERFKETRAYDKLTDELSTLGERAVEELARTASAVVLPALFNKIKSLIGLDLSAQQGAQRGPTGQQQATRAQSASSPTAGAAGQAAPSGASSAGSVGGSSAYTAAGGTSQS